MREELQQLYKDEEGKPSVDQILTLLDKEIQKASKHQLELVRDGFNLDSEDIDELNDRIKQLEKEGK